MLLEVHGHQAYCHTGGAPLELTRPVIVLVHGALNDHSVWLAQIEALTARGFAVLAPDLPGHGASGGPALASIETMAAWLLDLQDAAGIVRAVLAGHSMGSLIALEAAARAPHRATGLALLGTTYPMRVADALLTAALDNQAAAIDTVAGWSHAAPGPALEATRALMQRVAAAGPPHLLHTDLAACNAYADGDVAAAAVTCPTLLVLGTADRMTPPRTTARLSDALKHGNVVAVEAGHAMMADAPAAVADALLDFCSVLD